MTQVDRALLLLSLENLEEFREPSYLRPAVAEAMRQTHRHLRILVLSRLFDPHSGLKPLHHWTTLQAFLTVLYAEATHEVLVADNIPMNVEVIVRDPEHDIATMGHDDVQWDRVFAAKSDKTSPMIFDSLRFHLPPVFITIDSHVPTSEPPPSPLTDHDPTYPVVALGGTFDHLHPGHKILLSMSAWIATRKIIVGVTDDSLLKTKSNREVLESLHRRIEQVRKFLNVFKPGLEYEVVPLEDVFGPTGWDPDIQALVVSTETQDGANQIAQRRKERSLPPLEALVIEVISPEGAVKDSADAKYLKEAKMSSTFIRQWIVDHKGTREAEPWDSPPSMPGHFIQ